MSDTKEIIVDGIKYVPVNEIANTDSTFNNGLIGKYVIVRCRDAGVHSGFLHSHYNRECVLLNSRRLWAWTPANGECWLSGVANVGLDPCSRIGMPVSRIHLTENCEIIECTDIAKKSIMEIKSHDRE